MQTPDFVIKFETIENLFESLKVLCSNTGTAVQPSFGNESSFLSPLRASTNSKKSVLAIDVGGTRTKVCCRLNDANRESWISVLDLDNNELKTEGGAKALQRMTTELGRRISEECRNKKIALTFDGVSIVWSNGLQCFSLIGPIRGVGAKVFGSRSGTAYRKGEWWNSDIQDGDDISAAFSSGLKASGINVSVLIVGNDTVFTALAAPDCDAGVVASTGANTTIIPKDSSLLFNSECAAKIEIDASFLGLRTVKAAVPGSSDPLKLEDLCAGKGLPLAYAIYLQEAANLGIEGAKELRAAFETQILTAKSVSEIASGVFKSSADRLSPPLLPKSFDLGSSIAKQLVQNAGALCGLLVLVSVANQIDQNKDLLVALDSSQARLVPGYRESLDKFLSQWNSKHKTQVRYQLLEPQGQISVPLRGAANAIASFLTT
jgi:hypothetical protein